tara:strand:- start:42 stop:260 length:219 start_codon:yes stop_codon:yes gene_type:complete
VQSFFDSRERISRKVGLSAEQTPKSETFPDADKTKIYFLAKFLPHHAAQVAKPIDQSEFRAASTSPEFTAEQ